jgi:hypothetical protein
MAPIMALLLVLGRVLADAAVTLGQASVARITVRLIALSLRRGIPAAALIAVLLIPLAAQFGVETWPLLVLIPAAVLTFVVSELLRISFQSLLFFRWASAQWIASQAAQFACVVATLLIWHRVWPGILGIVIGAALVAAAFSAWFFREAGKAPSTGSDRLGIAIKAELPLLVSYSLFVLINNMDILLAYWVLPRAALDVYAASALLPKAIITATFPIAQIVLPVIVDRRAGGLSIRYPLVKAVAMAVGMGCMGTAVLWLIVPYLQQTPVAIRGLDIEIMKILTLGAIGLGAARVLVIGEIALKRSLLSIAQALAVVAFAAGGTSAYTAANLAQLYTLICGGFFVLAAALLCLPLVRSVVFHKPVRPESWPTPVASDGRGAA